MRARWFAVALTLLFGHDASAQQSLPFTFPMINWAGPSANSARMVPANRDYPEDSGYWHFLVDSELVTPDWLALHHYNADGGAFGSNRIIADFMYDAARRRVFTRSVFAREVGDPAELGCGRAPGQYPNGPDLQDTNDADHVTCIIGSQQWTSNGFSNYTSRIDFLERRGIRFRTTAGMSQGPVAMDIREDNKGVVVYGPLTVTKSGGNVLRGVREVVAWVSGTQAKATCAAGEKAIGGGGSCDNGVMRGTAPIDGGQSWELVCQQHGLNRVVAMCAAQ